MRLTAGVRPPAKRASIASASGKVALPLELVRSFQIPADDPSYERLLNWSWTYDSAVSAAAFASVGDAANAQQLLDQLAALQYTDGSIDIAFNTVTGASSTVFRAGTDAWIGLAAATYDQAFHSDRYLKMQELTANYLLSLQDSDGLIRGGPDVKWVSTLHNLIAYVFLVRLTNELRGAGDTVGAARYQAAAAAISTAINSKLLVVDASGAHFRQGLNDNTQALDVQALGAMYLKGTGESGPAIYQEGTSQPGLAAEVLAYAQRSFAVSDRSVKESGDRASYNLTYAAAGPFSGYAPYAGPSAPDILWAEGTDEMRLAEAALGQDTGALDNRIAAWTKITQSANQGPLQADRTVQNAVYGEYHVWPAAVAAGWTTLAQSAPAFFAAPLPAATSLVTNWTKVRGGNLITTDPDGQVAMTTGAGERRVLAGSATDSDYTVTSNATLISGAGYGVYVRATVNSASALSGYCVQVDHAYGQLIVRELQSDSELSTPLARVSPPTGFAWYGTPHVLVVTVQGNTMNVTLDGAQAINIPNLAAASATAAKNSYTTITPPTAGGYGLRAWSDGQVTLQQMTAGPA